MNRTDYYYRQKVLEDELDAGFDGAENADRALVTDLDLGARPSPDDKASYGGICWGFTPTNPSSLDISIASGAAYDELGQRIYASNAYTVTVTNEGDVQLAGTRVIGAGGTPEGAATDPGVGNEVWVSVYIAFDRLLSDERFDGYNVGVNFKSDESFYFHVVKGAIKSTAGGGVTDSDKPARLASKILLVDVHLKNTATVAVEEVNNDRAEWYLNIQSTTGLTKSIADKGNIRSAMMAMLDLYNDHVSATADLHSASDISIDGGSLGTTWADTNAGTYGGSTTVLAALQNIVTDLKAKTGDSGAQRIGATAQTGSAGTDAVPASLTDSTLENQLGELLAAVNSRISRSGEGNIAGSLTPNVTGRALGEAGKQWDAYLRDLYAYGDIKTDLKPDVTNTLDIGTTLLRYAEIFGVNGSFSGLLKLESGATFEHSPPASDANAFLINNGAGNPIFKIDTTKRGTVEEPLEFSAPAVIDAGGAGVPSNGAHGLRIVPTDLGLDTTSPKMELAFGPNASPTGGLNQYGVPISGPHFRDDFLYSSDITKFNKDNLPRHYSYDFLGSACTIATSAAANGGAMITTATVADNWIELSAGDSMRIASADWCFRAAFQVPTATDVQVRVGVGDGAGENHHMYLEANTVASSYWRLIYGNGATSVTSATTKLFSAGLVYVVFTQFSDTSFSFRMWQGGSEVSALLGVGSVAGATGGFQPGAMVATKTTAARRLLLHYWEWYRQGSPVYGNLANYPTIT